MNFLNFAPQTHQLICTFNTFFFWLLLAQPDKPIATKSGFQKWRMINRERCYSNVFPPYGHSAVL